MAFVIRRWFAILGFISIVASFAHSQTIDSLFLGETTQGLAVNFVSHFPTTAYLTERLLPFSNQGTTQVNLKTVSILQGNSCQALIDHYYTHAFHIYCWEAGTVVVEVVYTSGAQEITQTLGPYQILTESQPQEIPGE